MLQTTVVERDFPRFLRQLRRERGWTLERTAQEAGIARVTLNRWETGVHQPRLHELDAVLAALAVAPHNRRTLLAAMDSPRAAAQIRNEWEEIAQRSGVGPMPGTGDLLRSMRLRRGLSQGEVARRLGVTTRTLRFWETGEVRPPAEQLQRLCETVSARDAEIAALRDIRLGQNSAAYSNADRSLDGLEREWCDLRRDIQAGNPLLPELRLFALGKAVWPHAARTAQGRWLLAEVYVLHARYLSYRWYNQEARAFGERALALMPCEERPEWVYGEAAILVADAHIQYGGRQGRRIGAALLRQWLPFLDQPGRRPWALSVMAGAFASEGALAEALTVVEEACLLDERHSPPGERERREADRARFLVDAGRAHEALSLLTNIAANTIYFDASIALMQTRAYLAVGQTSAAQDSLQHAAMCVEIIDSAPLRRRVNAFSRQL